MNIHKIWCKTKEALAPDRRMQEYHLHVALWSQIGNLSPDEMNIVKLLATLSAVGHAVVANADPFYRFEEWPSFDSSTIGSLNNPASTRDESTGTQDLQPSAPKSALRAVDEEATRGKWNYSSERSQGHQSPSSLDREPNVHNGGVNRYPYTTEIRDYIVDQHNLVRATMAPAEAANMRKLRWNEALAIEASELVETCMFAHDTENHAYGQNLVVGDWSIDKRTVENWMKMWVHDEITDSDRAGKGYMRLNHASQALWASSYLVGCASKKCPAGYLTACNYFVTGNTVGWKVFEPGRACSQCPKQARFCDAQYHKLCTAEEPK